jgi:hypothetical protein
MSGFSHVVPESNKGIQFCRYCYEVRIHNTPVNPHRYMRETVEPLAATEVPQPRGE